MAEKKLSYQEYLSRLGSRAVKEEYLRQQRRSPYRREKETIEKISEWEMIAPRKHIPQMSGVVLRVECENVKQGTLEATINRAATSVLPVNINPNLGRKWFATGKTKKVEQTTFGVYEEGKAMCAKVQSWLPQCKCKVREKPIPANKL